MYDVYIVVEADSSIKPGHSELVIIQTYDEYGYSQDDYDSIFGNIIN